MLYRRLYFHLCIDFQTHEELWKTPSRFSDIEQQVSRDSQRADPATNDFKMDWAAWAESACTLGTSCVLMWVPALLRWEEARLCIHRLFFVITWAIQRSKCVHAGRKRDEPLALTSFYKQLWWAQHKQTDDSYLRSNREVGWRCMNNWAVEKMFQCYEFCQWPFSHSRSTAGMQAPATTSPLTLCLYSTHAFQEILLLSGRRKPGTTNSMLLLISYNGFFNIWFFFSSSWKTG